MNLIYENEYLRIIYAEKIFIRIATCAHEVQIVDYVI